MGLLVITPPRNRRNADLGGRRVYRRPKMGKQWFLLIPFGILAGYLQHTWMSNKGLTRTMVTASTIIVATKEVPCPHCVGEDGMPKGGRRHPDNLNLWEDCPLCFGAGRRIIKAPNPSNQQICPRCGGMGRYVQDARVTPCERCEEWGFIDVTEVDRTIFIPDEAVPPENGAAATPQPQPPVPADPPPPTPAP